MSRIRIIVVAVTVLAASMAQAATKEGLIAEGERALMAGNAIVAERAFIIGMNNYPDDPRFPYYGGVAALYLGRPEDAVGRLEGVVDDYPRASFFLAMIALDKGNAPLALSHIDRYLAQVPRDPEGELLKGVAQLGLSDPEAVKHFNLAAQLDKSLRSFALFYRGLSQFDQRQSSGADKALRAVLRLGEAPTLLQLAEQTLDVLRNRGDIATVQWTEAYVDIVYDDNLNRNLNRESKTDGMRTLLRARYWRKLKRERPSIIVGAAVEHDQPIAVDSDARTALSGIFDLGYYKGLENFSLDPGVEFEPTFSLFDAGSGFGLNQVEIALRPRLYFFQDHERSTKLFYEFGYVQDLGDGFFSGPRHTLGLRPSWTGANRRTYVSGLIALDAQAADAPAFRSLGPKFVIDTQAALPSGFIAELTTTYRKGFFRDLTLPRQEDALLGHLGIGWWREESKFVFLVGTDQELHLNNEPGRDWKVHSYWVRLGAYL